MLPLQNIWDKKTQKKTHATFALYAAAPKSIFLSQIQMQILVLTAYKENIRM